MGRRTAGLAHRAGILLAGFAIAAAFPAAASAVVNPPDLQTIIPTNSFSMVNTARAREFRYTHLVYNNGPGTAGDPAVPTTDASADYRGTQQIFTHNAAGNWSQVAIVAVARHLRLPRRARSLPLPARGVRPLRRRRGRRHRRARRDVAEERLLHRRLLSSTTRTVPTRGAVPGEPGQLRRPDDAARPLRRRGRRVRLPRSRPGDPDRRVGRRHVLVPGDDRPEQRPRRGRRDQQRDRRQGDDLQRRGDPGPGAAPGHDAAGARVERSGARDDDHRGHGALGHLVRSRRNRRAVPRRRRIARHDIGPGGILLVHLPHPEPRRR